MSFRSSLLVVGAAFLVSGCCCPADTDTSEFVERTYVHKYGVKVRPDYWADRGQDGQVVTKTRDGVVVSQSYCAGGLHGESRYTYPNSPKICRSEVYDNNSLKARNEFYPSGAPRETCEWTGPNQCTVTCWYEHGAPRCVEKFEDGRLICGEYFNKNHQRDSWVYNGEGERLTRDCSGCFLCLDEFCGGELIRRTYFYPRKGPREIVSYMNGVPHGERKTFYPDGSPNSIESWENGHQNGTTVIFQNGERYAEVPYLDGKKNGIERRYADGHNLSQELTWYNDKLHGPMITHEGDLTQTDWFYKGRLTTRTNFESYYKKPCQ